MLGKRQKTALLMCRLSPVQFENNCTNAWPNAGRYSGQQHGDNIIIDIIDKSQCQISNDNNKTTATRENKSNNRSSDNIINADGSYRAHFSASIYSEKQNDSCSKCCLGFACWLLQKLQKQKKTTATDFNDTPKCI